MRASPVIAAIRVLSWCCVILLAVLSLLPAQQIVRTGLPGRLEHFVAYAGSAAIAMAGYGAQVTGGPMVRIHLPPAVRWYGAGGEGGGTIVAASN
jgi:hypothetical protein